MCLFSCGICDGDHFSVLHCFSESGSTLSCSIIIDFDFMLIYSLCEALKYNVPSEHSTLPGRSAAIKEFICVCCSVS
jgi:hypothetical protein